MVDLAGSERQAKTGAKVCIEMYIQNDNDNIKLKIYFYKDKGILTFLVFF